MPEILNTGQLTNGYDVDEYDVPSMSASTEPSTDGISFYVTMNEHKFEDMQYLIVEAAASQVLGRFNDYNLKQMIEKKAIELVLSKIETALTKTVGSILDRPITRHGKTTTLEEYINSISKE